MSYINGHATLNCFWPRPWGPGEGSKGQISLNSITKSISKICVPNFLCVLSNERFKAYQTGFLFCRLSYALGVVLWGAVCPGGQKLFYFKHGHVAYQIDGKVEQNRMQVIFSSYGQTGNLGVRSKGQISLNFDYQVNSKFLFQTLCAFLQIKDRKHIEQNFHPVAGFMPQGWDLGCWVGQKLKHGHLRWRPIDCAFEFVFFSYFLSYLFLFCYFFFHFQS